MAADARSTTGAIGEAVAKAVENQHFDRTALSMARKLFKLAKDNPLKFSVTFPHLLAYCDDLSLDQIAAESRGLPINGEGDEDEDGQTDIVDQAEAAARGEHAETPAGGKSPALSVVPGPNAPHQGEEIPPAPDAEDQAA